MYSLPKSVEQELERRFPNIPVKQFTNALIEELINSSTTSGECKIREFGKFVSFKTFSKKLGTEVVRFRFKISPTFSNKIKFDKYILNNVPVKTSIPIDINSMSEHSIEQRNKNNMAFKLATISNQRKKNEKIINDIFNSDLSEESVDF